MNNGLQENDLLDLSSTYAFLTADRILDRFGLALTQEKLTEAMRTPRSVYFQLLLVPFKNIINGIIYQQAYDYQVYLQKVFVDYLVSGSGNEDKEAPGATVREDLDENRLKLIALSEQFDKDGLAHKTLINQSQAKLLDVVRKLSPIQDNAQMADEVAQTMAPFLLQAAELAQALRNYRVEFKTLIVDTRRLLELLPDYRENSFQDAENRSTLQFDDQLG